MAQKRGLIGPQYGKHLGDFVFFLVIPKLLIWAPGHIAVFCLAFLELPKIRPNMDPYTPYLLPKYFKQYKKYGNVLQTCYFCKYGTLFFEKAKP